jgi:hypothetical protein
MVSHRLIQVDKLEGEGSLWLEGQEGEGLPVSYVLYIERIMVRLPGGNEVGGTFKVTGRLQTRQSYRQGIALGRPHDLKLDDGRVVGGVMFENTDGTGMKHRIHCNGAEDLVKKYMDQVG